MAKINDRHLIVISLDGFGAADIDNFLRFMPNLSKLVKAGTHIKNIRGVYPSQSYPSHASMITGQLPDKHGIVNDQRLQINKKTPDWYWFSHFIKSPTILELAENKGMKVATFMWPSTLEANFIDYNIAPTANEHLWNNQNKKIFSVRPLAWANKINRNFKEVRQKSDSFQPTLDKFIVKSAADLILEKKPNLILIRLTDLDVHRRRFGVHSEQANQSILRLDKRIGEIVKATVDAGIYDQTNFSIISDHYLITTDKMIHLNMLFEEHQWLSTDKDNQINANYKVIGRSSGGSVSIYLKDKRMIGEVIEAIVNSPIGSAIDAIYKERELKTIGVDPKASLMLEAKPGFYFTDETNRPFVIEKLTVREFGLENRSAAADGYHPNKPMYTATMVLSGPNIKKRNEIWQAEIIDAAPTFAEILGLKFKNIVEGQLIKGAFVQSALTKKKPTLYSTIKEQLDVKAVDPKQVEKQKTAEKNSIEKQKQIDKAASKVKAIPGEKKITPPEKPKKAKETKTAPTTNKGLYQRIKDTLDVKAVDPYDDARLKREKAKDKRTADKQPATATKDKAKATDKAKTNKKPAVKSNASKSKKPAKAPKKSTKTENKK